VERQPQVEDRIDSNWFHRLEAGYCPSSFLSDSIIAGKKGGQLARRLNEFSFRRINAVHRPGLRADLGLRSGLRVKKRNRVAWIKELRRLEKSNSV